MTATPKDNILELIREEKITPEQAVRAFESLPLTAQKGGRMYQPKSTAEQQRNYQNARNVRRAIRASRIPFISKAFLPGFWLSQGLVVVGAESGRAKSTTCANVLVGFLLSSPTKRAVVISNEEATDAVFERAACIILGYDYTAFFRGSLSTHDENKVVSYVEQKIIPRVEVIEDSAYDMSYFEDVCSVLESSVINDVGIVLIDYLQVITQSRANPNWEAFQVSKALGLFLKEYGRQNGIPVVCFAQLHSTSRGPTMAERVQNDKTFYNHGFACIEILPDFETLTTTFRVHKDRFFGHTGKEVVANFKGGRYEFVGDGDAL